MSIVNSSLKYALALSFLFTTTACGDEENHDNHEENHENHDSEENPHEEACLHMQNGPSEAITANAEKDLSALPDATKEHTRVDITLVTGADFGEDNGGYVRYEAEETGDYAIFVSADVALEITDGDTTIAFEEEGEAVTECTEVSVANLVELEAGKSYQIKIGPTSETEVRLVIEHGEHEHEE